MEFLSFFSGIWFAITSSLGFGDGTQNEQPAPPPPEQATIEEQVLPREIETGGNRQPAIEEVGDREPPSFEGSAPAEEASSQPSAGPGGTSGPAVGAPESGRPGGPPAGGPPNGGPGMSPSGGERPDMSSMPSGPGGQSGGNSGSNAPSGPGGGTNAPNNSFVGGNTQTISSLSLPDSDFLGSYEIDDSTYGTEIEVTVSGNTRTIVANALPNHDTGAFPNSGNPHSITAQSKTYTFPSSGSYTGSAIWVREPGVAVNGVKFEPETAEVVSCSSGESYKIEAFQDEYDLGFDENHAHVQPTGEYHYHGFPTELVELYDDGSGLIHIGFAEDGNMIYYDDTGTVEPSWQLSEEERSGTDCTYRDHSIDFDNIDFGTFVSDWEYVSGSGNLDACNGAYVDGEYAYFVTEEYPYISRCLQGSF